MKDNLLVFYLAGVALNFTLVVLYVRMTTTKFSGHFKGNLKKIGIKVDIFGNLDPTCLKFSSASLYVALNILMSWVFVPFNFIILFVRVYGRFNDEHSNEVLKLNNRLKNDEMLNAEEVFVLFQLCDKSIIPNIFCKAEIMDNLKKHNALKSSELCPIKVESHLDELIKPD